jgi:hypothetical protein
MGFEDHVFDGVQTQNTIFNNLEGFYCCIDRCCIASLVLFSWDKTALIIPRSLAEVDPICPLRSFCSIPSTGTMN